MELYPPPSSGVRALPPPGRGLNQPALLTFRRMAVRRSDGEATLRARLVQASTRMGGVFVHYDAREGVWMLKVDRWV